MRLFVVSQSFAGNLTTLASVFLFGGSGLHEHPELHTVLPYILIEYLTLPHPTPPNLVDIFHTT